MKKYKEWIYKTSDDNTSRFILGTKGKKTIFVLGINPSTAEPNIPDQTIKSVERIAEYNGYDSWVMLNVYPQRATSFEELSDKIKIEEHEENIKAIKEVLFAHNNADIWLAFGNHIYDRDYLADCLKDIYSSLSNSNIKWYSTGVTQSGAPKHPLYQKSDSKLIEFDIERFLNSL